MIDIEPLRRDQYRQVAELEYGPQPDDVDWDKYAAEMSAPKWLHFGLYSGVELVGCLSLEKLGRHSGFTPMAAYHVVTARHRIHPQALARLLLSTASYLFKQGFTALVARIPREDRAAARLAIRCYMWEWGHTPTMRYFMLTKKRFEHYGRI